MWITIEQLVILEAISKKGSISAAAEELNKAKSALHYSIKRLEEQVEFKILDTGKYRGVLTLKAEQLLNRGQKLLVEHEKLKSDIHRIRTGVEQKVAFSASALFNLKVLNKAVLKIQKKYPETEIIFHREILSGERMLKRGLVDLSILSEPTDPQAFHIKKIATVEMMLTIAKDHAFKQLPKKKQTLENLFNYPQVIQRSTLPDDDDKGVYQQSRRWTVSDLASKKQIIIDGLGWGRLPFHEVEKDMKAGRIKVLKAIEKPFTLDLYMGRLRHKEIGIVGQTLWDSFEEI